MDRQVSIMITPMSVSTLLGSSKDKAIGIVLRIETCLSMSEEEFFDGIMRETLTGQYHGSHEMTKLSSLVQFQLLERKAA